jgi:uncharacterized membrane protein
VCEVRVAHLGEIAAVGTAITWAIAVILFRKSGQSVSPLALNLFKNSLALPLLVPTVWLAGERFQPGWTAHEWLVVAASGVLGVAVGDTLFFACLNRIGAGLSAIVDCLYAPLVLVFSFVLLGEHLSPADLAGGVMIVSAVLLTSANPMKTGLPRATFWIGAAFGALSMTAMALGAVLTKPILDRSGIVLFTSIRLAIGNAPLLLMLLSPRGRSEVATAFRPSPAWRFSMPGSFLGAYLGMILWLVGIRHTLVVLAALLNQLSVVVVIVLAWMFLKEPLTARKGIAVLLAAGGAGILVWL